MDWTRHFNLNIPKLQHNVRDCYMYLQFDGDTVLCRVCGDKASGFHYGVHACEGCKGFFRRSIQQKIQYRPCLKNQQCNIMRVNRNRCQYCRLKKCISVGMSRDAVRFGRVPKKEKARIIEQMQKVNLQIASTAISSVLYSRQDLVQSVIEAHRQTCDLSQEKTKLMRGIALMQNDYVNCPAHMACPLNSHAGADSTDNQDWTDFSEFFAPAIKSVVDFAKLIPGFLLLNQDDQVTLLKAATFEVLLVRMACLFDTESSTMMFANGKLFRRQTTGLSTSVGFLLDSMFDFAERFNKLNLSDDELALFSAVVLLSPDRPGLRQLEQVEKIQNKLTTSLQNMINTTHREDSTLFAKLLMKTTDLRTLNALHAEKTVGQGDKPEENFEMGDSQDSRSEDSVLSDSSSLTTHTSTSGMDMSLYDSTGSLGHPSGRFANDAAGHQQQMVLKTPYGTFYREDGGYYGMMPEPQPRRRCHTLDRDSQISRPRLHTIEEGTRRRYTMDREYINKMVGKLSDRLEKRAQVNSVPGSVSNSAASSPVPIMEEQYSLLSTNPNRDFIPISTPDSLPCSSRTSPSLQKDTLQPFLSSPNSPRPRSGSIGTMDEYGPMRPRCSSFHMNSEGHAAAAHGRSFNDADYLSQDGQHFRMTADMRRGSVGASYNLHARKKSLLVDRHPAYLSQAPDMLLRKSEKQRSPLATDESKRHHMGSSGSAFEQVPHLAIPPNISWGPNMLHDMQSPPKVSVTAPTEDSQIDPIIPLPVVSSSQASATNSDSSQVVSPDGSARNSPDGDLKNDELYHKKFDKFRKHNAALLAQEETRQMENLSIQDTEPMEAEDEMEMEDESGETVRVKVEKSRKSAGEAHPQLLAQLQSGPQFNPVIHPAFQPTLFHQQQQLQQQQQNHLQQQHMQQQQQQMQQLQQQKVMSMNAAGGAAAAAAANGVMFDMSKADSSGMSNVVLSVPQAPFVNRTSPTSSTPMNSMSGASPRSSQPSKIAGKHKCLESLLRTDTSRAVEMVARGNDTHLNTVSHLKNKIIQKYPSSENLAKIESDTGSAEACATNGASNGRTAGAEFANFQNGQNFPNGQNFANVQRMLAAGYQPRAAGLDMAALRHTMAMYPHMYMQQPGTILQPPYNEHLAGMQQMVYGGNAAAGAQQPPRRSSGGDLPLNLTAPPMCSESAEVPSSCLVKKIKEEVIS